MIIFFTIGLIIMLFMMMKTGSILKTPETPTGILNIEFAKDTADMKRILKAWTSVKIDHKPIIEAAKTNTYWDFAFIFFSYYCLIKGLHFSLKVFFFFY